MDELVSIITPCYNGAKYLLPFLESVLAQTYRPIELIFIDDGSTDDTKMVFESYRERFVETGITPIYIYQENAGQAAAMNTGLPIFKGEYLMWVDSDDIILPNNIAKKVEYLNKNLDKGFVLCEGWVVNSSDLNKVLGTLSRREAGTLNNMKLFEDLIMEHNVVYGPATIMARRQAILYAIPSLHIYEGRQGQNWQLMLPLAYCCKYGLIEEPLFKYVVHDDSHSHIKRTYEEEIRRAEQFEELIVSTISSIPKITESEVKKWIEFVHRKYLHRKVEYANLFGKVQEGKVYRKELNMAHQIQLNDMYFYYRLKLIGSRVKHFWGNKANVEIRNA